jgi:hypothetical protein
MFTRGFLAEVRRTALRRRVWYSALDGLERGILTLAGRVVDEVRNTALNVELVKIIAKLRDAAKSGFVRHVEAFGIRRVREVRDQAVSLGSLFGGMWARDIEFVRYLAFLDYNQPRGWGSGRAG